MILAPIIPDGQNPDKFGNQVTYEKGGQFLSFIEKSIGEKNMQDFLR